MMSSQQLIQTLLCSFLLSSVLPVAAGIKGSDVESDEEIENLNMIDIPYPESTASDPINLGPTATSTDLFLLPSISLEVTSDITSTQICVAKSDVSLHSTTSTTYSSLSDDIPGLSISPSIQLSEMSQGTSWILVDSSPFESISSKGLSDTIIIQSPSSSIYINLYDSLTITPSPSPQDVDECLTNNGGCEHVCHNTIGSFYCSCNYGFVLNSNGMNCNDINECNSGDHGCSQTCSNTPGSYSCDCWKGYHLDDDGMHCIGGCWPSGTYALPKPQNGCPDSNGFTWQIGFHSGWAENSILMALPVSGHQLDLSNHTLRLKHCIKSSQARCPSKPWPQGCYCIYKKYSCPLGFSDGIAYLNSEDRIEGFHNITFDSLLMSNKRMDFCCRCDGDVAMEIDLPRLQDFYLMRHKDAASCQEVLGMKSEEHTLIWNEKEKGNENWKYGDFPFGSGSEIRYCYYTPERCNPPCESGGVCIESNTCLCHSNFVDSRCNDINECIEGEHFCTTNQICQDNKEGYECICKPGLITEDEVCKKYDVFPVRNITIPNEALDILLEALCDCFENSPARICVTDFLSVIQLSGVAKGSFKESYDSVSFTFEGSPTIALANAIGILFRKCNETPIVPLISDIQQITYVFSTEYFIIETKPSQLRVEILPPLLVLQGLSLRIVISEFPACPEIVFLEMVGCALFGSLEFAITIDITRPVWEFLAKPKGNNSIDFVALIQLMRRVPFNALFKAIPLTETALVTDIYITGQFDQTTFSLILQMEGILTIGDWFRDHFFLVLQHSLNDINNVSPQFGIITGCRQVKSKVLLSSLVSNIFGVDIHCLTFIGNLPLSNFRLAYLTSGFNAPLKLSQSNEQKRCIQMLNSQGSSNFAILFDLFSNPFELSLSESISLKPTSFESCTFNELYSAISDSLQIPRIRFLSDIDIGNISITNMDFNLSEDCLTISGVIPQNVTLVSGYIHVSSLVISVTFSLAGTPTVKGLCIDGKIYIGLNEIDVSIKLDPNIDGYLLEGCSDQVDLNLLDIAKELSSKLIVPSVLDLIGITDLILHQPCFSMILGPANNLQDVCISGSLTLESSTALFISGCVDEDRNWVYGLTVESLNLTGLINRVVKRAPYPLALLDQHMNVTVVISEIGHFVLPPLDPKITNAIEGPIREGITLYLNTYWPPDQSCTNDLFCSILKTVLKDDPIPNLNLWFPSPDTIRIGANVSNFVLGSLKLSSPSIEMAFYRGDNPHVAVTVHLILNDPPKVLKGDIVLRFEPQYELLLKFWSDECWLRCFNINLPIDICNLVFSTSVVPSKIKSINDLVFNSTIRIGNSSCKVLEAEASFSLDPLNPRNNFLYATITRLTLRDILDLFCISYNFPLPNFIANTGFPNGLIVSYSHVPRNLPLVNAYISAGLTIRGRANWLGVTAFTELVYDPSSSSVNVSAILPPIRLPGNILTLFNSKSNQLSGPSLFGKIQGTTVSIGLNAYISVLGVSVDVTLAVSNEKFEATLSGSIFNILSATFTVYTRSVTNIQSNEYRVSVTLRIDVLQSINQAIMDVLRNIADVADRALRGAQEVVDAAQDALDVTNRILRAAESAFKGASDALNNGRNRVIDLRNRLASVCTIKSCGSVCVPCTCGCSVKVWGKCIVPGYCSCCSYTTDPLCLAANVACEALKKPIESSLRGAEAVISGLESGFNKAQVVLQDAQAGVNRAQNVLNNANDDLGRIRARYGSDLDISDSIRSYTISGIVKVVAVTFDVELMGLTRESFVSADIRMTTCCIGSFATRLRLPISNPQAIASELVNRYKVQFARRKKRSGQVSLKTKISQHQ